MKLKRFLFIRAKPTQIGLAKSSRKQPNRALLRRPNRALQLVSRKTPASCRDSLCWPGFGPGRKLRAVVSNALLFKAGPGALQDVRKRGFSAERIGTIAGASGGAKWLVLSQLDRVIIEQVLPRLAGAVHLVGSSIGAWRFDCYAQA